jgi:orotidine-5'-phosphate decarboxylase
LSFVSALQAAWRRSDSLLCVGLDPDPARFPAHLKGAPDAILRFCTGIVDATADLACAFKPQIAYFAAERAEDQLEALITHIHDRHPGVPVILDAKRGDIGSTAEQYAREVFERYRADAVTLSPYMGFDSIEPYLAYPDRGAILLCRTSNAGGSDLQALGIADGHASGERICTSGWRGWCRAPGTAQASSGWSWAPPFPTNCAACANSRPGCPCWCRASAHRAVTSTPPSQRDWTPTAPA